MSCSCALIGIASRVGSFVIRPATLSVSTESQRDRLAPRGGFLRDLDGHELPAAGATRTSSPGATR